MSGWLHKMTMSSKLETRITGSGILMILQHGGVQKDHLEDPIQCEISQFYEEFKDIVTCGSNVAGFYPPTGSIPDIFIQLLIEAAAKPVG